MLLALPIMLQYSLITDNVYLLQLVIVIQLVHLVELVIRLVGNAHAKMVLLEPHVIAVPKVINKVALT